MLRETLKKSFRNSQRLETVNAGALNSASSQERKQQTRNTKQPTATSRDHATA